MRVIATLAALAIGGLLLEPASAVAAARSFFAPKLAGERLAFCLASGKHCGKTVADAWCQFNGYDDAVLFQRETIASLGTRALYPDTGAVCTGEDCVSFREIKCRREI